MSERIPEDWSTIQIKELGSFYGGLTGKTAKDFGDGEPFLTYMQVFLQKTSDKEAVNSAQITKEENQNKVIYGDILFTTSSETPDEIGMSEVFLGTDWSPYLNSFCFGLRLEKPSPIYPLFAKYLFRGRKFRHDIRPLAQGSTRYNLSKGNLGKLSLLIPPLQEQKKIASILTSVDEVIEKTQLQINKLQDLKKGTMNELLTKGIGHTEFKDSELGRIPVSWEVASLGSFVLDQKSGASLSPSDFCEDGFGVIPKKAVQFGGRIVLGDKLTFCTNEFADNNRKNIVSNEYVIAVQRDLVPSGPSIGLMGMLMEGAEFILAQGVYGYLLDSRLNPLFLSLISNTDWYRGVMRKIFVGSTQIHIRSTEFLEVVIPIPPVEEQNDIAERINMMESQILLKQKIKHKFSSLKNSLMQDLLTGRVRVSL